MEHKEPFVSKWMMAVFALSMIVAMVWAGMGVFSYLHSFVCKATNDNFHAIAEVNFELYIPFILFLATVFVATLLPIVINKTEELQRGLHEFNTIKDNMKSVAGKQDVIQKTTDGIQKVSSKQIKQINDEGYIVQVQQYMPPLMRITALQKIYANRDLADKYRSYFKWLLSKLPEEESYYKELPESEGYDAYNTIYKLLNGIVEGGIES